MTGLGKNEGDQDGGRGEEDNRGGREGGREGREGKVKVGTEDVKEVRRKDCLRKEGRRNVRKEDRK